MGRLRDGDSEGRAFMKGRERIFIRLGRKFLQEGEKVFPSEKKRREKR